MKTLLSRTLLTITLFAGFAAGPASASDGSGSPAVTQTLELSEGWNLVALTVRPDDATLFGILAPVLEDIVLVRDHEGRTMVPGLQIDEIGEWDVRTAYEIFARDDVSLTLSGTPLEDEDLTFELVAGWNAVPFVGRVPIPVSDLFGNGVVLVQDSDGRTYWPEHHVNEINELVPGEGYRVFASREVTARMPEQQEKPVYRIPAHIDASGVEDVSHLLMEFIASVPDSSIIRFDSDGTYRIERTVTVADRHGLEFENGNFITDLPRLPELSRRRNRTRSHWSIERGSGIVLRGMSIRGAHPNGGTESSAYVADLEAQHGVNIWSADGVTIENCVITDVYGDFVYIGNQGGGWAENIRIVGNSMERNGRQGIAITGARNVLIEGNNISHVRRSVFDIEANSGSGGAEDVFILNNTIGPKRLSWLANGGSGSNVRNIVIEGNYSTTTMLILVLTPEGHRRGPFRVANNVSTQGYGSPTGRLMEFRRVDGLEVVGNTHPLQSKRPMYGARLTDVTDYQFIDNDFRNGLGDYFFSDDADQSDGPSED